MALRVWLPLNGNLNNQGLSNIQITNTGATINDNGKLGKAYEFGASHWLKLEKYAAEFLTYKEFSLSVWFKCTAKNTSHGGSALISAGNWNAPANLLNLALSGWSTDHYTRLIISGSGTWDAGYNYNFNLDTWYHVVLTSGDGKMRAYVNGNLIGDTYNAFIPASLEQDWVCIGNGTYYSGFIFNGLMNDVRIYDECLSQKQVKELSKGLIAHYKLSAHDINNNLAVSNPLVASGASALRYDNETNTYTITSPVGDSTWGYGVNIGSTNKCIVPYNSFYRFSFEVLVPTEHELRIDYNNYANEGSSWGGNDNDLVSARLTDLITIPGGVWTKCVFGSQNANVANTEQVAIYEVSKIGLRTINDTEPTTWYLRNFKFELGDTATDYVPHEYNQMEWAAQDNSGNGYNGIVVGTLKCNSDSTRYLKSVYVDNSTDSLSSNISYIKTNFALTNPNEITFNWWGKHTFGYQNSGILSTSLLTLPTDYTSTIINQYDGNFRFNNSNGDGATVSALNLIVQNEWHMYTLTYDGTTVKSYRDGALQNNASLAGPLASCANLFLWFSVAGGQYRKSSGNISDFRIYATALSADEILTIYKNSGIIDNKGNMYAYEFKEE